MLPPMTTPHDDRPQTDPRDGTEGLNDLNDLAALEDRIPRAVMALTRAYIMTPSSEAADCIRNRIAALLEYVHPTSDPARNDVAKDRMTKTILQMLPEAVRMMMRVMSVPAVDTWPGMEPSTVPWPAGDGADGADGDGPDEV